MKKVWLILILMVMSVWGADTITLNGTIRDFYDYNKNHSKNPDFENPSYPPPSGYGSYAVTGLVKDQLDQDSKPVLKSNTGWMHDKTHRSITDANSFSQWYRDVDGINQSMPYSITLHKNSNGLYEYSNDNFFPIDGKLIGNEGPYGECDHNYHFTYEIHSKFTYKGGETFRFAGDDDVWVFIDNKLVVDIGGIHGRVDKSIKLDDLGLTKGKTYNFDLFFAERHIVESHFKITTSIELEDKPSNAPANAMLLTRVEGDKYGTANATNVYVFHVDTKTDKVSNMRYLTTLNQKFKSLAYKDGKFYSVDYTSGKLYSISIKDGSLTEENIKIDKII